MKHFVLKLVCATAGACLPVGMLALIGSLPVPRGSLVTVWSVTAMLCLICSGLSWLAASFVLSEHSTGNLVPAHLEPGLQSLSDGVLVANHRGQIVFVNDRFCRLSGSEANALLGRLLKELDWQWQDAGAEARRSVTPIPWIDIVRSGERRTGQLLTGQQRSEFVVTLSSAALPGLGMRPRGAIIRLEDETQLLRKTAESASLLETVRRSAEQNRKQHSELEHLALNDPGTGCLNRRSGFEVLEKLYIDACRSNEELACVAVDIDQFRLINEQFGYKKSDDVLHEVARCVRSTARDHDVVMRCAGDRFALLMPRTSCEQAAQVAERIRSEVSRLGIPEVQVTASLGISELTDDVENPQQLLDQAEASLELAKSSGRNRIVRYDEHRQADTVNWNSSLAVGVSASSIPFPAVTGLLVALDCRDRATAAHCRRVATHCAAVGQRLMSWSSGYILEVAALLHDVGKVGISDTILKKRGPLTTDQREVIDGSRNAALEIVRSISNSAELIDILEYASLRYDDSIAQGRVIPVGARILAVADAYDSMIHDQGFRDPLCPAEAIAELRRCAGGQFDPEIVAQFIEVLFSRRNETLNGVEISRDAALALGVHMESLASAADHQDLLALNSIATAIADIGNAAESPEIAAKALELEQASVAGTDLLGTLRLAGELLGLCRAAQHVYVASEDVEADPSSEVVDLSQMAQ